MKALVRFLTVSILSLGILTIAIFEGKKDSYIDVPRYVASHVVSFNMMSLGNARFATGFHLEYKDKVYIVTNKHVCDLHKRMYIHDNIQFEDYVGEIIKIDDMHDLCLVTSNRKRGLSLASKFSQPLDKIIVVGHPRGLGKTIRHGYHMSTEDISAPWIGPGKHEAIMVSATAYGGNSGSPVTNSRGEVIGVLFAGSPVYHTETLVVPLEYLIMFLEDYAR